MAGTTQHTPETLAYFLTLPDERIILAERKHPAILTKKIFSSIAISFPFYMIAFIIFEHYLRYPTVFFSILLVIISSTLTLILKAVIDWHFHLFIVTNRKILEVNYSPCFFYNINGVLLDQVRCTEIDEKKHGILNELVDMGDVVITFDRPTHQEDFIFTDIHNPRNVANLLSNMFATMDKETPHPVWYRVTQKATMLPIKTSQSFGRYALGGRI